jgi:hypothetical protein
MIVSAPGDITPYRVAFHTVSRAAFRLLPPSTSLEPVPAGVRWIVTIGDYELPPGWTPTAKLADGALLYRRAP